MFIFSRNIKFSAEKKLTPTPCSSERVQCAPYNNLLRWLYVYHAKHVDVEHTEKKREARLLFLLLPTLHPRHQFFLFHFHRFWLRKNIVRCRVHDVNTSEHVAIYKFLNEFSNVHIQNALHWLLVEEGKGGRRYCRAREWWENLFLLAHVPDNKLS